MLNAKLDTIFQKLIFGTLVILALGLVTSTSLLALSHIFMAIPALYFLAKTDYKKLPKSAWAFLVMVVIIILSILVNQDIIETGYKSLSKTKYFIFGFASIVPFSWYFTKHWKEKEISILIHSFCIATTVATVSGLIGFWTGFNPILMKEGNIERNSGLFGMLMNYSHNLAYFLIILIGLVLYSEKVKNYIQKKYLILFLVINLVGLYFTYTRGAWLALVVGIPFFFFKKHKKAFLGVFITLIFLGIAAYFIAGKNVVRPHSNEERTSQWQAAIRAFGERPIFGYGFLNFEHHSSLIKKRYDLPAKNFGGHAHSNFFEMLGSTGILGFTAFVVWVFLWFKEMHDRKDFVSTIGLSFIMTFLAGGLTQSTISLGINLFFVMAVYAISQVRRDLFLT